MTKAMNKKSIIISAGVLFAAIVTGCILWIYYMTPSSYLALDVNPSIEIHTNRLNQVTSIEPVNEDAKQIMIGYELTDRNLETVIHNIVDRIILGGFLAPDKDNTILISTDDSNSSAQISDTVNTIITNYLTEKQLSATVIPQSITVTSQSIEEAHDNYVSIGKMALIQELIANDNTLTVEQLSPLRISDLITLAESKNISLAGLFYSASTVSNSTNEIQEDTNNDAIIDTEEDNSSDEDALEDRDNEDQEDNELEDSKDGDNEDQDDNEDQEDREIEDREDNDNHDKSNMEDREDNDQEDQEDNKIEDREDSDEDDQEDSHIEDREDGDNEDKEDSYLEDLEGDDNEDQEDGYHVEQKSNDDEDQNEGDNED